MGIACFFRPRHGANSGVGISGDSVADITVADIDKVEVATAQIALSEFIFGIPKMGSGNHRCIASVKSIDFGSSDVGMRLGNFPRWEADTADGKVQYAILYQRNTAIKDNRRDQNRIERVYHFFATKPSGDGMISTALPD